MNRLVIERILEKYGMQYQRILPPQKGYRNESWPIKLLNGTTANLILYKSEPGILDRIRTANSTSNFLHTKGFPTRRSIGAIITLQTDKLIKYGALYNYLPGSTIPWEAYRMEHIKSLGGMMSQMHAALQYHTSPAPSVIAEYRGILKHMRHYFARDEITQAIRQKLALAVVVTPRFSQLLEVAEHLPAQTLHMDFVRGNILFDGTTIVGILDFEKAARGPRIFDIARTLAFLLVDCKYKQEAKIRKYFMTSGYTKRGQIPYTNPAVRFGNQRESLLEGLIDLFLLYDFYKFLRHNPYEFLHRNEHFIRTRDLLVSRQVIAYNKTIEKVVTRG